MQVLCMREKNESVIKNQEEFFNKNALEDRVFDQNNLFYKYANKEQEIGFEWLEKSKKILEYGVGTGTSLDVFFEKRNSQDYEIYGVDIAQLAIKKSQAKYPNYRFYKIFNNKISQIKDSSLDACYMFHLLHHSRDHRDIFKEVYSKLQKNGKFLINDLSSNNPITRFGRSVFSLFPAVFKNKFKEDLVVDGKIPEKYKVDIGEVCGRLEDIGFVVEEVGYGHLFFFVFNWIDRFLPLSRLSVVNLSYNYLIKFETWLLTHRFFQKWAELFYVKCVKKG